MSCSAPLFSYSRFRDNGDLEDPDGSSDVGTTVMIVVIVVVLVAAAACCWCFSNKSDGCGSGGCARAGGRVTNGSADEVTSREEITTPDAVLVMFYANWCGHCKTTKPTFKAASTKASVRFLLVDCDKIERELLEELGVEGFPTIMVLKNGKQVGPPYAGDRTEVSFLEYAASVKNL